MKKNYPVQQKGKRVPSHFLEKVGNELKKTIDDKEIIKLDKYFISPVDIKVKHDKRVKMALYFEKINYAIHENKYKMKSIDHLTDEVSTYISERKKDNGHLYFSKIDLKYAQYSGRKSDRNVPLHQRILWTNGHARNFPKKNYR